MHSTIAIIEGVTGSGKTTIIKMVAEIARGSDQWTRVIIMEEEKTLGNIMNQVGDQSWQENPTFESLDEVIKELECLHNRREPILILVERFHLTSYALFPRWQVYRHLDQRLAKIGTKTIFLGFPERLIMLRSIDRPDRALENWAEGMAQWYGSRENAVAEVRLSQVRRRRALKLSRLPFLCIDTRTEHWLSYAKAISAFLSN